MSDIYSKEKRSQIMRKIKGKNTKPEIKVRKWLHQKGFRFRLHRQDLPGKPDIVLPKYKTVIFINGCFWHQHQGCQKASTPKTNQEWWKEKFKENTERDQRNQDKLTEMGWKVIVIWECEIKTGKYIEQLEANIFKIFS